jgi:hypothetical protein
MSPASPPGEKARRPKIWPGPALALWVKGLNFQDFSLFRFLFIGKEMKKEELFRSKEKIRK